ncbi:hypothetical protein PG993_002050 [Apiospora rasikravindrae]|uniref:RRM domain-containing protein n=1 Tax=Apiospora rasikravindrae TaxID=990691 RepID=A0ABR1UFX5_9PEZI
MALHYAPGLSGSKSDDDIIPGQVDDGPVKSLLRGKKTTPVSGDDTTAHPGPGQESTTPSAGTAANTSEMAPPTDTVTVEGLSSVPRLPPSPQTAAKGGSNDMNDDPAEVYNPRPATNSHVQGHRSTFSGASTLISHSSGANAGRDDRPHAKDHEAEPSKLDPAADAYDPEKGLDEPKREQQPEQQERPHGSARKHHCSTEYAIGENRRIYIGNLTFTLNRDDIAELLHQQGVYKPDCCCIYVPPPSSRKNPKTAPEHQNRGYCFATFRDSDNARLAMKKLDHIEYAGRKLVCRPCLPKGLTYSQFLERQKFIKQGGALGLVLPQEEEEEEEAPGGVRQQHGLPHEDQSASYDEDSPSKRPSHQRRQHNHHRQSSSSSPGSAVRQQHREHREHRESPGHPRPKPRNGVQKKRSARQYHVWYHRQDGPYMTPEQQIMPEPIIMPGYHQAVNGHPPPTFNPFAGSFGGYEREHVVENAAAANDDNGGVGVVVVNDQYPYKPPHDSSKADGRTIELLNLPPVRGGYFGFKACVLKILEGFNVTGVSEAIYQYNPNHPPFPLIREYCGPVTSYYYAPYCPDFPHQCPLFYCYVQLESKEEAVRALGELNGMDYMHFGDVRKFRVNTEWKLHCTD